MRYNSRGQIVTTVTDLKKLLYASVKANNYRVELNVRYNSGTFNSRNFNLLVKSTTLPERRINIAEVWYRGRKVQLRSEQENSGEWECTAIDDDNMSLRKSMTKWFESIDSMRKTMNDYQNYMVFANIYQLNVQGSAVFGVRLNNVFLSSIGSISFDDSSNDQLSEFSITFAYSEIQALENFEANSGLISGHPQVKAENYK